MTTVTKTLTCEVYTDPGHAWVKVPIKKLRQLGVEECITSCSYRRGDMAYLEEDCDALRFMKAAKEHGVGVFFNVHHANRRSRIRGYASYRSEPSKAVPMTVFEKTRLIGELLGVEPHVNATDFAWAMSGQAMLMTTGTHRFVVQRVGLNDDIRINIAIAMLDKDTFDCLYIWQDNGWHPVMEAPLEKEILSDMPEWCWKRIIEAYGPASEKALMVEFECRRQLRYLQKGIFDVDKSELKRRHRRMDTLKGIMQPVLEQRHQSQVESRLVAQGY